ncbi:MAG: DUF975 family protein [Lachnospiraceae bacterium]|nr:DUF975 family protein [Lachnospiraceae bacterium]
MTKRNFSEIKASARKNLKGNLGTSFLAEVAGTSINMVATIIPFGGTIISGPIDVGTQGIYVKNTDQEKPRFLDLFNGFKENFGENFLMRLVKSIFIFLWSLLFIIPGLVKSYSYAMTEYLMARNQGMTAMEAIRESRRLMNGNKMRLFLLNLSFIGWTLLLGVTLGLAAFYVVPYMKTAKTEFFNDIYFAA